MNETTSVTLYEAPEFPRSDRAGLSSIGQYELKGFLGRGGMGVVYEAYDTARARRVAIKIVRARQSPPAMSAALSEARALARLAHPNVVFLYGAEPSPDGLILVMELLPRGTLADHLRHHGPARFDQAVGWALELIEGLQALESRGLVHRDIKPSNCFLTENGSAKVGDLGLVIARRASSGAGGPGQIAGAPPYSPPEQLRGQNADHRSDIYSLGCTLYEILAGRPPFLPRNLPDHLIAVEESRYLPLNAVRPACPPGLRAVIARAMEPRAEQRFQSLAGFADALRPYILAASAQQPRWLLRTASFLAEQFGLGVFVGIPVLVIAASLLQVTLSPDDRYVFSRVLGWTLGFVYFGLGEGLTGTSLVRSLVGLHVIDEHGAPPGLRRALIRNIVFFGSLALLSALALALPGLGTSRAFTVAYLVWLVAMFAFVDSRGVHGILSGTRLVRITARVRTESQSMARTASPMHQFGAAVHLKAERRIGRYEASMELARDASYTMLLGHDPLLGRPVWLFEGRDSFLIPAAVRSGVERPSRLHWIDGQHDGANAWAAFEVPDDVVCFTSTPNERRKSDWARAFHILQQVASEIELSLDEGTLPRQIGLSSILLDRNDRLILSDVPIQPINRPADPTLTTSEDGLRSFLRSLVVALRTGALPGEHPPRTPRLWNEASRALLVRLWVETPEIQTIIRRINEAKS